MTHWQAWKKASAKLLVQFLRRPGRDPEAEGDMRSRGLILRYAPGGDVSRICPANDRETLRSVGWWLGSQTRW